MAKKYRIVVWFLTLEMRNSSKTLQLASGVVKFGTSLPKWYVYIPSWLESLYGRLKCNYVK